MTSEVDVQLSIWSHVPIYVHTNWTEIMMPFIGYVWLVSICVLFVGWPGMG